MIDVGQGDSTSIYINGHVNLLDTGGIVKYDDSKYTYDIAKNKIVPYLKSSGIRSIDNLILTHGDFDHMKESEYIIKNFNVKKIYINENKVNDLEKGIYKIAKSKKIKISKIKEKEIIETKGYKFYSLNRNRIDENDSSIVIYTNIDNYKILLTGDISKEIEKEIIKKYNLKNINILKLAHHGSKTSNDLEFLKITRPTISIISVGIKNKYNHPSKEVIDNLKKLNILYYETDKYGSIKINLKTGFIKTFPP